MEEEKGDGYPRRKIRGHRENMENARLAHLAAEAVATSPQKENVNGVYGCYNSYDANAQVRVAPPATDHISELYLDVAWIISPDS